VKIATFVKPETVMGKLNRHSGQTREPPRATLKVLKNYFVKLTNKSGFQNPLKKTGQTRKTL